MRYFDHLGDSVSEKLFYLPPEDFDRNSQLPVLAMALGATLYIPGSRSDLARAIKVQTAGGVRSMVIDLEDAVSDSDLDQALDNTVDALVELSGSDNAQLFVRVRTADQIDAIAGKLRANAPGGARATPGSGELALSGFVLPKFDAEDGAELLAKIRLAAETLGTRLLAMPVLETPEVFYHESRIANLLAIRKLLNRYRDIVLAVRIGATDLCGLFGIRRDRDLTIYDVRLAANFISAVVNTLGRLDGTGFTITGTVWEYFANHERMLRPQLRATPFEEHHESPLRERLVTGDLDALMREIILDRGNGLKGKTVIHPTHVPPVHALSVVTHEEYADARDVLASDGGGVSASEYRNKMNESRPHRRWAKQTVLRASVFGVSAPDVTPVDLLAELMQK